MSQELKLILASIKAGRLYSVVSIVGLSIAIVAVILVSALTRHELAYEKHYANYENIYRLNWINGGTGDRFATMFNPFSPPFAEQTEEVEAATRVGAFEILLSRDTDAANRFSNIELVGFVDPEFFGIFDFPFTEGDSTGALASPNSIVVTRAAARKYFPGESPLGQTITFHDSMPMTVSAVIEDMPASTHFPFHFIVPLEAARELYDGAGWLDAWGSDIVFHYILAQQGVDPALLQQRVNEFAERRVPYEDWDFEIAIQALENIHFMPDLQNEMPLRDTINNIVKSPRQKSDLALFMAGAVVLVLIASFNFMNLQIARGVGRSRQLGLLKVVGGRKRDVFQHLLVESLFFAVLALLLALPIVELMIGVFSSTLAVSLTWADVMQPSVIALVSGLTIVLGIMAGAYPAWIMASQKPSLVLKGEFSYGHSVHRIRNVLVLLQFAVSIVLIAVSLVIYSQIRYSISAPLGFDANNVAIVEIGSGEAFDDYETLRLRLMEHPDITAVTRSSIIPTGNLSDGMSLYPQGGGPDNAIAMRRVMADFDFFETFGMNLRAGRGFTRDFTSDEFRFPNAENPVSRASIVINEMTATRAGWTNPADAVGKILQNEGNFNGIDYSMLMEVVGVVEDVHFRSLRSEVVPMIFFMGQRGGRMAVKVSAASPEIENYFERVWNETIPDVPMQMSWLDDSVSELYDQETRTLRLLAGVSVVAIGVACLGLFAVASLITELRRKEIALRKVFGATIADIISLLSWRFMKSVMLANVIALPLAWLYLQNWLTAFVYRIELGPVLLLIPAVATLLVAWATVAAQAFVVARRSPIHSLRYE